MKSDHWIVLFLIAFGSVASMNTGNLTPVITGCALGTTIMLDMINRTLDRNL